jgi:hypothetical protein
MLGNILGTPGDYAAIEHGTRLSKVGVGNADGDFGSAVGAFAYSMQQTEVAGQAAMHFPVAGDEFDAHREMENRRKACDYSG